MASVVIDPESGSPSRWLLSGKAWGHAQYEAIYNHYMRRKSTSSEVVGTSNKKTPTSKSGKNSRDLDRRTSSSNRAPLGDKAQNSEPNFPLKNIAAAISGKVNNQVGTLKSHLALNLPGTNVDMKTSSSISKVELKTSNGKSSLKTAKASSRETNEKIQNSHLKSGRIVTRVKYFEDTVLNTELLFVQHRDTILLGMFLTSAIMASLVIFHRAYRHEKRNKQFEELDRVLIDVDSKAFLPETNGNGSGDASSSSLIDGALLSSSSTLSGVKGFDETEDSNNAKFSALRTKEEIMEEANRRIEAAKKSIARTEAERNRASKDEVERKDLLIASSLEEPTPLEVQNAADTSGESHVQDVSEVTVAHISSSQSPVSKQNLDFNNPEGPMLAVLAFASSAVQGLSPFVEWIRSPQYAKRTPVLRCSMLPGHGKQLQVSSAQRKRGSGEDKKNNPNVGSEYKANDFLLAPLAPLLVPKYAHHISTAPDRGINPQSYDMLYDILHSTLKMDMHNEASRYDPIALLLKNKNAPSTAHQKYDFVQGVMQSISDGQAGPGAVTAGKYDMIHDLLLSIGKPFEKKSEKGYKDPLRSIIHNVSLVEEWGPRRNHSFKYDPLDGVLIGDDALEFWQSLDEWGESDESYDPLQDILNASAPKPSASPILFDPISSLLKGIWVWNAPDTKAKYDLVAEVSTAINEIDEHKEESLEHNRASWDPIAAALKWGRK